MPRIIYEVKACRIGKIIEQKELWKNKGKLSYIGNFRLYATFCHLFANGVSGVHVQSLLARGVF
jgi:hypothetical protein